VHAFAAVPRVRIAVRFVPLAFAALAACAAMPAAGKSPPVQSSAGGSSEHDPAALRDKVEIARLQLAIAEQRAETARTRKEKELEIGKAELAQFEESDAPNRLARSKLELARRRDALAEQQEELAQLEMMYEQQDLADKTREIVLQRGKRRVERAQEELAISERDAAALESRTLPRERAKLALEIEIKERELVESKSDAEATLLEKRLAVRSAEDALATADTKASGGKDGR
jgi:hypothetical protein